MASAAFGSHKEGTMRNVVLIALAAGGLALFGAVPAHAVGTRYPFCIQGNEFPGLSNCTFTSYAQCMATASGRFLTCVANPYFAGRTDDPYAYHNRNRPFPPTYYSVPPGYYPHYYPREY
jgi:hypothetical protein